MNKVLIATRNKDKFKIVSKLLTSIFKNYKYYNLNDLDEEIIDKKESGDVINRSYEKAKNAYDSIKNNDFKYIVGIDDGIKIRDEILENVKELIKPIINDEYLNNDEVVYIVRAYTFFSNTGDYYKILTEIPFKYKKITYNLEIEKNSYPLSHVLRTLDSDKTVIEQNFDESNNYYLKYSENKFKDVEKYFDDKNK